MLIREAASDPIIASVNMPLTIALTLGIAGFVGALGCAAPTIRGRRIQPSQALRESSGTRAGLERKLRPG